MVVETKKNGCVGVVDLVGVRRLWGLKGRMEKLVMTMSSNGGDSSDGTVVKQKKEKVRVSTALTKTMLWMDLLLQPIVAVYCRLWQCLGG